MASYIFNLVSQAVFGSASGTMDGQTQNNALPRSADRYRPSAQDVFSVKQHLIDLRLPLELVDSIIDHAEYWPHIKSVRGGTQLSVRAGSANENRFIVSSLHFTNHIVC